MAEPTPELIAKARRWWRDEYIYFSDDHAECEEWETENERSLASLLAEVQEEARREGREEMRERAAALHESIDNDCDRDRFRRTVTGCGCGAMGAVIEYRDAISALPLDGPEEGR